VSENPERTMMHMCECFIDNNSEKLNVIWKGDPDLVPWPEIKILMEIHGEHGVYDIKPVALAPHQNPNREKERLVLKYGRDVVEIVYAGKSFNMEWFMPGWPVDPTAPAAKDNKGVNTRQRRVYMRDDADTEDRV
jgi:hypothetical protein